LAKANIEGNAWPLSPDNHLINNTTEHIFVYRKPGKARSIPRDVKEASAIPIRLHRDLTQRVWWMYPQDVKRARGHPAAFPQKLPGRLIGLYTFIGDVVRDPFCGTGTTCAVARPWVAAGSGSTLSGIPRARCGAH